MQVCKYHETKLPDLVTRIQDRIEKDCKKASKYTHYSIINPRCACAAKVTVVVLCVCVSATILALQATRRLMSDTNSFSATRARKIMWRFC